MFKLNKKSKKSQARAGVVITRRGFLKTPFFMPVATQGAIKTLDPLDLGQLPTDIILANTYHLFLRPGLKILKKIAGLHNFMGWQKALLTDSGGFQIFSLAGTKTRKNNLVRLEKNKVIFSSHLDGKKIILTPIRALQIQKIISSDIQMVLDVCSPGTASYERAKKDLLATLRWAQLSKEWWQKNYRQKQKPLLFGIVQGGVWRDLREFSARELVKIGFDGYAVGGLAVGESTREMYKVLSYMNKLLPATSPRYLMGVGRPENIVRAVKSGMDMFDCVIPTREARHGRLYLWQHKNLARKNFYQTINITNRKYSRDFTPLLPNKKTDEDKISLAYLHHLFKTGEPAALRLATLHNLNFYLSMMQLIRQQILAGEI